MSEHRYDIRITESCVDLNPLMAERQDQDNFPRLQTREGCPMEIATYVFKFPRLFRKPKNVEIPKRLRVRAVEVDSSNNFLLTLQDILNPDLSLTFGKVQLIK